MDHFQDWRFVSSLTLPSISMCFATLQQPSLSLSLRQNVFTLVRSLYLYDFFLSLGKDKGSAVCALSLLLYITSLSLSVTLWAFTSLLCNQCVTFSLSIYQFPFSTLEPTQSACFKQIPRTAGWKSRLWPPFLILHELCLLLVNNCSKSLNIACFSNFKRTFWVSKIYSLGLMKK